MGAVGVVWTIAQIARKAPKPVRLGTTVRHDLDEFTVIADPAMPLQVDGEWIGERNTVRFRSVPCALNVLVSPDL
jgi:diacylglycerol kinase family enzyme